MTRVLSVFLAVAFPAIVFADHVLVGQLKPEFGPQTGDRLGHGWGACGNDSWYLGDIHQRTELNGKRPLAWAG